jgi:5-enolpyruvylshikimate-3-phosphate synthase
MLRAEVPEKVEPAPDLRGEIERRRDAEMVKHFSRMAELDVIAELAEKNHEVALAERAEEVRRKETDRFRDVMQELKQLVAHKEATH